MSTVTVVSHRSFVLATTAGRTFQFAKGEPTIIPRAILEEVMRSGVVPVDDKDLPSNDAEAVAPDNSPVDPTVRKDRLKQAIKQLQVANNREAFSASGAPKVTAVEKIVGFDTSAKELAPIVQELHDEAAAAVEAEKLASKKA